MTDQPLAISTDDAGVRWLRLNRPDSRNAIDLALQAALGDALVEAARDEEVRAIVVTGTDPAFSAGGDLSRFTGDDRHVAFRLASHELTTMISLVERVEKPVVAAINGVATGAGTQLALACDVRIASEEARFVSREGHIGLLPSHGGIARLVRLVGLGPARDLVLGGFELDACRAYAVGLVSEVVAHDQLAAAVSARLRAILQRSPDAYAVAKRVLNVAASTDVSTGMAVEALGQSLLLMTAEHRERLARARSRSEGGR
ncbi:MAG: enoyl-CoA hydratase/isomerase family protein [Egibacteraceae bacterium]